MDDDQDAKQFDLLMLRLQLGLLRHERSFTRLSEEVREIAAALEEKVTIPMVRAELELILEVQTDEFWQDITTTILESTRKRLRTLVKFIEKKKRRTQFADFTDELGEDIAVQLLPGAAGHDVERFREKTLHYLKGHENDPVILKLRWNEPLTAVDLDALEKMLIEAGAGTALDVSRIRAGSGLGLFVRSLVGMDREAAKRAFAGFLDGKAFTANQIHFVNLMIDDLTRGGWMNPTWLYESPFTDFSPKGVDRVFDSTQVTQLVSILNSIREAAAV